MCICAESTQTLHFTSATQLKNKKTWLASRANCCTVGSVMNLRLFSASDFSRKKLHAEGVCCRGRGPPGAQPGVSGAMKGECENECQTGHEWSPSEWVCFRLWPLSQSSCTLHMSEPNIRDWINLIQSFSASAESTSPVRHNFSIAESSDPLHKAKRKTRVWFLPGFLQG